MGTKHLSEEFLFDPYYLDWPVAGCCMTGGEATIGCLCPPVERALRGWSSGKLTVPMTKNQREYCLKEIAMVEGHTREEHEQDNDRQLALSVIDAWVDYSRDKGML